MMNFLVTTESRGSVKREIWHSDHPLLLGPPKANQPIRWIAEQTGDGGVRVRLISLTPDHQQNGGVITISAAQLARDEYEFELPRFKAGTEAEPAKVKIRHLREVHAAFNARVGRELSAFYCLGTTALQSYGIREATFVAKHGGQEIFALNRAGADGTYKLNSKKSALLIQRENGKVDELAPNSALPLTAQELVNSTIILNKGSGEVSGIAAATLAIKAPNWRFALTQTPDIPVRAPAASELAERKAIQRTFISAAIGLLLFGLMTWLWPKPSHDVDEVIAPQVAKLILQAQPKPKKVEKASAGSEPMKTQTPAQKRVEKTAVAQAFRAKALQSAVSGLLKGGMTKLLDQSQFAAGSKNSEASKLFDTRSDAFRSSAPEVGNLGKGAVTVANIGGEGVGGGKVKGGVGYGKGENAAVKGQGQAFVSTDISSASVDEGLTKDEVGEVIHRHLSEVRFCYESAMIRRPDIEGKLMTSFTIGANGMIKSSEIKETTLPDPRLDDCILRRLVTWKFPNPRGGIDVAVTYPFIFKTLGR